MNQPRVASLRAELRDDTAFVAVPSPRLTWTVESEDPAWIQASVDLTDGAETVSIDGRESVLVAWPFVPLKGGEAREIRVRARSESGPETDWSEPLRVEAGFLGDGEWIAQPVGLAEPEREAQPVVVRTAFELAQPVERALLFW